MINLKESLKENLKEKFKDIQRSVASRVLIEDWYSEEIVAGVDQAFLDDTVLSGAVAIRPNIGQTLKVLKVAYKASCSMRTDFPYVPGFLSFREGPAAICSVKKLDIRKPGCRPTLLFVDGCGINHPRMAGLASYIGVMLDVPTIGISKGILCGTSDIPEEVGGAAPLRYEGGHIGFLLKSKKGCRPIVVAPGHRVSVESSLELTRKYLMGHKLPEPVSLAHEYVNQVKAEFLSNASQSKSCA